MVMVDAPHGDSATAPAADELFTSGPDLQTFFDHAALLEVKAGGGGGGNEEEEDLEWLSNKDAFPAVETMAPAGSVRRRKNGRWVAAASSATGRRRCCHCGTERTPQWRGGPEGARTLCNACGVRYRAGRLVPEYRPLSSPTFRPELHSNRHRRVLEMRCHRREEGESAKASADGEEEKWGEELAERTRAFSGEQKLVEMAGAFWGGRPRTRGLRRPRRVVGWSLSPPPRAPASDGAANSIHLWRSTSAQHLTASAAAPIAGGALRVEVGLEVSAGGLVKRLPLDRPLAPAPAVGKRRCGTEWETRQAPAAPGPHLCWNCGAEQTPPAPAAKPVTGQQQCQPSATEKTPRAPAAKPAGQLRCGLRGTTKTPAASAGQLLREPRETKNAPRAQVTKPVAVEQLLCEHGRKNTPRTPVAKPAAAARRCRHCGTEETPRWRHGPDGPRTLCNACGVRYLAGRLVPEYRPLNSPTFSPELHSNIRRHEELTKALPAVNGYK